MRSLLSISMRYLGSLGNSRAGGGGPHVALKPYFSARMARTSRRGLSSVTYSVAKISLIESQSCDSLLLIDFARLFDIVDC